MEQFDLNFDFNCPDRESPMPDASDDRTSCDRLNEELRALIQEGLKYPKNSPQRRKLANEIIRKIQKSGKLFTINSPHYEDALMLVWRSFCRNLWQATTAKKPYSDPACKIINRLNSNLIHRVRKAEIAAREEEQKRQESRSPDGEWQDIAETIAAPEPDAQIEQLRELIHTDPTGELRTNHVRGKTHITAQLLLQRRGLADEAWKDLEADLKTRASTLSGFYQERCLPLIRRLMREDE